MAACRDLLPQHRADFGPRDFAATLPRRGTTHILRREILVMGYSIVSPGRRLRNFAVSMVDVARSAAFRDPLAMQAASGLRHASIITAGGKTVAGKLAEKLRSLR